MTSNVLIVDDEEVLADAMREYLTRHGYSVTVRSSGEDALMVVDREPPDIVVLDYRLPLIDGLQVLRRIKEARPEIEVVILTAHGSVERAVEAMKIGAFEQTARSRGAATGCQQGAPVGSTEPGAGLPPLAAGSRESGPRDRGAVARHDGG